MDSRGIRKKKKAHGVIDMSCLIYELFYVV